MNTTNRKIFPTAYGATYKLEKIQWVFWREIIEIFLKKKEHHKKGVSLYTLCWDLKIIPFTLYTFVLAKILQNDAKIMHTKTDSWFKKSLKKFGQLQISSRKSYKLKFDRRLCQKNILLQLKDYIKRIYSTLLSTTCVKVHQMICHKFTKFEAISHFSWQNPSIFF